MKRVKFGINDDANLSAGFSRIDMTNVLGEYLDSISLGNENYLVTRVLQSENEKYNGKIDVREIAQDVCTDGTTINYSSKEKSEMCLKMEQLFNSPEAKEQLRIGEPVSGVLKQSNVSYMPANIIDIFSKKHFEAQTANVTSVDPEIFEQLKQMTKTRISSFKMYSQIVKFQKETSKTK
ncbi:MAG: hypothetical protein IKF01_02890 [Bacilli bacterium]|nr:hypothetical protein [Bacilli bacterium]